MMVEETATGLCADGYHRDCVYHAQMATTEIACTMRRWLPQRILVSRADGYHRECLYQLTSWLPQRMIVPTYELATTENAYNNLRAGYYRE